MMAVGFPTGGVWHAPTRLPAGESAAGRLVVVDSIDAQAAGSYRHESFITAPEHPLRLYRRIKDIRASLESTIPPATS